MFEKCILEQAPKIEREPEDLSDETDSTILKSYEEPNWKESSRGYEARSYSSHATQLQFCQKKARVQQCTQRWMWRLTKICKFSELAKLRQVTQTR